MPNSAHTHRALVVGAALAVALSGTVLSPAATYAVSAQTQAQLSESETKVEQSANAYNDAVKEIEDLQAKIDANTASISELEAKLPELQQRASSAMREIYKAKRGANPLLSLLMKSQTVDEFLIKMVYMNQVQDANLDALTELEESQQQLEKEQTELDQAKTQLEAKKDVAAEALAEAQKLRSAAQAKAEAEAAAEVAAQLAAAEQEKADTAPAEGEGASGNNVQTNGTVEGEKVTVQPTDGVNWDVSYDEFVSQWAGRINNYLAGSPLAGMGEVFAIASWNTGVDPRWSPAISTIESSKGAYCANSYNAWGWSAVGGGWRAFSSWEDGINQHVAYLGRVYGTTLTPAAAKKYCPPTWQDWYNKVATQMARI